MKYDAAVRNALVAAQADAAYLRLDCTNDPLTAELDGVAFDTYNETELVTNGAFTSSTGWDFGGDWEWNALEYAEMTGLVGESGNLSPSTAVSIIVGKQYILEYELLAMSLSTTTPSCGGETGPAQTTAGVKTWRFTATTTADLNFYGELIAGVGKHYIRLDNVSLREVGWLRGYGYLTGGAEFSGSLVPAQAGGGDLGEDGTGVYQIWLYDALTASPNLGASGLVARFTNGDFCVGNDNVFPGYYAQRTVLHNSTAVDNTDDFTNLYQGDSSYQMIAMMYAIEHSASPQNGVCIGDGTSEPPALIFGASAATGMYCRLDRANNKWVMRSTSYAQIFEIGLAGADPTLRPDTDALIDLGDQANTLRWRHLYLTGNALIGQQLAHQGDADTYLEFTDDQLDAVAGNLTFLRLDETTQSLFQVNPLAADIDFEVYGDTGPVIQSDAAIDGLGFFGATPVAQPAAYTPTNVTTDRAYDADAITLDELADVLGTLIADLQSLGLIQ